MEENVRTYTVGQQGCRTAWMWASGKNVILTVLFPGCKSIGVTVNTNCGSPLSLLPFQDTDKIEICRVVHFASLPPQRLSPSPPQPPPKKQTNNKKKILVQAGNAKHWEGMASILLADACVPPDYLQHIHNWRGAKKHKNTLVSFSISCSQEDSLLCPLTSEHELPHREHGASFPTCSCSQHRKGIL